MGCCQAKEPAKSPFDNKDSNLCVAYIDKKDIKFLLEKNKKSLKDDALIRRLMKNFDKEIDLKLLL